MAEATGDWAVIAIGAAERVEELRERLAREFEFLRPEGIEVQMRTVRRGTLTFVGCDPVSQRPLSAETARRIRFLVANVLSDLIVNRWEEGFLRRLIRTHYGYFEAAEQERILERAARSLHARGEGASSILERVRRKGRVLARLAEYLDRHNELVVDGFVTFRMRDYVEEMEEAVDLAVEDYLMEKEQQEFVDLLRSFLSGQEPRLPLANLVFGPEGFRILDSRGEAVTTPQMEQLGLSPVAGPSSDDEHLVSALLALVPEVLVVHRPGEAPAPVLETVRGVFGDRAVLCEGCRLCQAPEAPPAGGG